MYHRSKRQHQAEREQESSTDMNAIPASVAELNECLSEPDEGVNAAVEQMPGDFIVLGAGGKTGFHVCRMLQRSLRSLGRPDQVIAVSRFSDPAIRSPFDRAGFDVRQADLTDSVQLAELPDVTNVFYLAGIKFGTHGRSDLLHRFNIEMPQRVAERYRDSRIVALSTACVYSYVDTRSEGAREDAPTDAPGEYAQSCVGREQAFAGAAERWGTRSSLIRLSYSIDLRYGVLVDIAEKVLAGSPIDVVTGCANVIWQRDAVSHIIQALLQSSAPPCVLNVTGPTILRVRKVAEAFGEQFHRKVTFTGSEADTAWLCNPDKAHGLFGAPQTSIEQMINWTAAWLQRGGETLAKPTHFETRDGNF